MDSFYGGKQGISFVIKDRFTSIDEMNIEFAKSTYETTWYGEYCIINTKNKNDKDNGKIFKRTAYNAASDSGSSFAEYIGQIVGPAGGVPNIQIGSITDLKKNFDAITVNDGDTIYYKNNNNNYSVTYPDTTTPSDQLGIQQSTTMSVVYKSAKDYYNTTTPSLSTTAAFKYGFYTFQTADENNTLATLGIGFEIPYVDFLTPSINMVPQNVSPSVTCNLVDGERNKFLYRHEFNIPAGVPGPYIGNIHTVQVKPFTDQTITGFVTPTVYPIDGYQYIPNTSPAVTVTAQPIDFTDISSSLISVGNLNYQTQSGTWESTTQAFFIGEASTIEHMVVLQQGTQYRLYAKYGGYNGTVTLSTNDEDLSGYCDLGIVGPPSLGPWTIHLTGQWQDDEIVIDNLKPDIETQGNLGIISTNEVRGTAPAGVGQNVSYFYLWEDVPDTEAGQWLPIGQTSYDSAYIDTDLRNINIMESTVTAILHAEAKFNPCNNLDSFEAKPWI